MRVHRVRVDEAYQGLKLRDPKRYLEVVGRAAFQGLPMADRWVSMECVPDDPKLKRGDFLGFSAATFAFTENVRREFNDLFNWLGEILPITVDGIPHYVLNVLRRVDALDKVKTHPDILAGQFRQNFEGIEFQPQKISEESLFFISEYVRILFCASGQQDAMKDFLQRCQSSRLSGLEFTCVWQGVLH